MAKHTLRGLAILTILAVVFSIIAFLLPVEKNGVFLVAYLAALVSIAVQGYALYTGFVQGGEKRSKLYGFPIARIGTVYMAVQLILSLIFILLAEIAPLWLAGILCVLALAAAVIGLIAADAVREEVERQEVALKVETRTIKGLIGKARALPGLCDDPKTVKVLKDLAEELRYSDPVSADALVEIEGRLENQVDAIHAAVAARDYPRARDLAAQATQTLAQRNQLCRLGK